MRLNTPWQRGSSLIEMLITLLILCISVIAIGIMMNASIHTLTSNIYQQRAARLAGDLAEQLAGLSVTTDVIPPAPVYGDCTNQVCDPGQYLAHMLYRWHGRVGNELPAGQGGYTLRESHGLRVARINVSWRARGGATLHYATTAQIYASE